jgi:hypothetical protein
MEAKWVAYRLGMKNRHLSPHYLALHSQREIKGFGCKRQQRLINQST